MRTQWVGDVDLDLDRLRADLDRASGFHWSLAYSDYLFGGSWRSCMVYTPGGTAGNGVVTNYDTNQRPDFTEYGAQLPYVSELISGVARLECLNFARLVEVSNSVVIPHRDLLELADVPETARNAHRVHIPLLTHDQCFFNEEETVYRMRRGEVWFLDASRLHSVAAFTDQPRIHLMLDFVDVADDLLVLPSTGTGDIPERSIQHRPPLPDELRAGLRGLATVTKLDTLSETFSIVIKHHFCFDGGPNFVWDTMFGIGHDCADPAVLADIARQHRHYTLERVEGELLAGAPA